MFLETQVWVSIVSLIKRYIMMNCPMTMDPFWRQRKIPRNSGLASSPILRQKSSRDRLPNRTKRIDHAKSNCTDETSSEEQFPFVTGLLEPNSNNIENTSNPDQRFTTSSIQHINCNETANCLATTDCRIPPTLPPSGDEISSRSRGKGNSVLNLERTLYN